MNVCRYSNNKSVARSEKGGVCSDLKVRMEGVG